MFIFSKTKPPPVVEGKEKRKALGNLVMLLKEANFEIGLKIHKSKFGKSKKIYYFQFIDKNDDIEQFVRIFNILEIKYTRDISSSGSQIIHLVPKEIEYIHNITFQYQETLEKYTWKLYQAKTTAEARNSDTAHDVDNRSRYNDIQKAAYKTLNESSPPRKYICIPDQNGIYSTSNECNEYAHPNEITDNWTRKYLKYKMKYLNLKLLDK